MLRRLCGGLLLLLMSGVRAALAAPEYSVESCCHVCPAVRDPAAYRSRYQQDFRLLLEGSSGWLFRSGIDMTTTMGLTDEAYSELRRFVAAMAQRGTRIVFVYQPPRALMDVARLRPEDRAAYNFDAARAAYSQALDRFAATGMIVPRLDQLADPDKGYDYYFRRDHHWTPAGAERTAQQIAVALKDVPEYAGLPKQRYVTTRAGLLPKSGTFQKVVTQLCGFRYPTQYIDGYATRPEGAAGGEGDAGGAADSALFDDNAAAPQVVLAGTSNSAGGADHYNFPGALQQHLGTDVLNQSVIGGMYSGALLQYLPSEAFQKSPPKLLIWETPYADFSGDNGKYLRFFRQIIPMVNDGCHGRPAVLQNTVTLHAGSNEVLFNGKGGIQPLISRNYQADLQFSDPSIKEIHPVIWYYNGRRERLKLHYNQYVNGNGRFVVELRHDLPAYSDATLMALNLQLDEAPAKPMQLTATVCERRDAAPAPNAASLPADAISTVATR